LGPEKLRAGHQLERQNGAKCREITQKGQKRARVKLKNTPKTLLLMPFSR